MWRANCSRRGNFSLIDRGGEFPCICCSLLFRSFFRRFVHVAEVGFAAFAGLGVFDGSVASYDFVEIGVGVFLLLCWLGGGLFPDFAGGFHVVHGLFEAALQDRVADFPGGPDLEHGG